MHRVEYEKIYETTNQTDHVWNDFYNAICPKNHPKVNICMKYLIETQVGMDPSCTQWILSTMICHLPQSFQKSECPGCSADGALGWSWRSCAFLRSFFRSSSLVPHSFGWNKDTHSSFAPSQLPIRVKQLWHVHVKFDSWGHSSIWLKTHGDH